MIMQWQHMILLVTLVAPADSLISKIGPIGNQPLAVVDEAYWEEVVRQKEAEKGARIEYLMEDEEIGQKAQVLQSHVKDLRNLDPTGPNSPITEMIKNGGFNLDPGAGLTKEQIDIVAHGNANQAQVKPDFSNLASSDYDPSWVDPDASPSPSPAKPCEEGWIGTDCSEPDMPTNSEPVPEIMESLAPTLEIEEAHPPEIQMAPPTAPPPEIRHIVDDVGPAQGVPKPPPALSSPNDFWSQDDDRTTTKAPIVETIEVVGTVKDAIQVCTGACWPYPGECHHSNCLNCVNEPGGCCGFLQDMVLNPEEERFGVCVDYYYHGFVATGEH